MQTPWGDFEVAGAHVHFLQTVGSYRKTMMKKRGVNNVARLTQLALAAQLTHWNKPDADTVG